MFTTIQEHDTITIWCSIANISGVNDYSTYAFCGHKFMLKSCVDFIFSVDRTHNTHAFHEHKFMLRLCTGYTSPVDKNSQHSVSMNLGSDFMYWI